MTTKTKATKKQTTTPESFNKYDAVMFRSAFSSAIYYVDSTEAGPNNDMVSLVNADGHDCGIYSREEIAIVPTAHNKRIQKLEATIKELSEAAKRAREMMLRPADQRDGNKYRTVIGSLATAITNAESKP